MAARWIVRFFGFVLLMGATYALAQYEWTRAGLDDVSALADVHAVGLFLIAVAPLVLAVVAAISRRLTAFVAGFIVAALLTAPLAFARISTP